MASILYGPNGNDGFLSKITGALNTPQNAGMAQFGNDTTNYLGANGAGLLNSGFNTASSLQNSNIAAPYSYGPSQNDTNLAPAYNSMIYGDPANNPYLTGAIQKGINQSNNAFGNMLTDATRNLNENVLPSIRSGAIVNGSMGSSRQGIAESRALNDFSTQMGRAASQYGQNNTDAAVSAQAGAYDAGQNRALSAMNTLSGQQYGLANSNLQAQLQTNQLNSANKIAGLSGTTGLLNNAYNYGTNQDAYNLNKLGTVSGLLSPYTGLGASQTQSQPLYQNTAGNILGGAITGASIWNMLNKNSNG
jgi:hypothetical protein